MPPRKKKHPLIGKRVKLFHVSFPRGEFTPTTATGRLLFFVKAGQQFPLEAAEYDRGYKAFRGKSKWDRAMVQRPNGSIIICPLNPRYAKLSPIEQKEPT